MTIVKITELPAATSPVSPSDVAAVVQGGITKKAAISQFGFAPQGTGAVTRTIQNKLQDSVSVKDFGAVGDGVADDTLAIQNAFSNGGLVYFPEGTYKVTTIVCLNVNNLSVDATAATFTSVYGNVVVINNCDDFSWTGGIINAGMGANPAYSGAPYVVASNFTVFDSIRVKVSNLVCNNSLTNQYPCIAAWVVSEAQVNNNRCVNGGDNSIWFFGCTAMTASNNLILNQTAGRAICFQQVNQGAMTGNVILNGKGDGLNVHGSANIVITGNSVYNMATDTIVLQLSSGCAVEWDENATSGTVAAAVADPTLYNFVFSRNITISGNTFAGTGFGIRVGNNVGTSGANYGNQGQVVIDGNNIFDQALGLTLGTSRQIRVSNNMIARCLDAAVAINMGTDTGGFKAEDIYIQGNRITDYNRGNNGFAAIAFTNGTPTVSQRIFMSDNQFDQPAFSAAITNISNTLLANMGRDNVVVNGVVPVNREAALNTQSQFGTQTAATTLNPYFTTNASHQFTQSGLVGDSFTTVLTLPDNASIMAHIQIGLDDRLGTFGMIIAQNGDSPSLSFTGTGSGNVQMSGADLQIKGNTSGGTANYGGLYTIRYNLLLPG
jgi:hypothetical protein